MADKKINITEKDLAWQRQNPPTHTLNPHEDKTLTPRAELLPMNERHERKRKCCGHPWTGMARSCQITSKNVPWNVEGVNSWGMAGDFRRLSHGHRGRFLFGSGERDTVDFKTSFSVTMLILCGAGSKRVKDRRSTVAIEPKSVEI